MAAGSVKLQANDLKVATVSFEDGAAANVTVTLPKEGGKVVVADSLQVKLDGKQNTLVSGTSIKTINSTSLLGSGNIAITDTAWIADDSRAKTALNATGSAPIYACRAWVNFNGTGTVAIRASGNVSSITDNGVADYTINFITAMPDANYSTIGSCGATDSYITNIFHAGAKNQTIPYSYEPSTSSIRCCAYTAGIGPVDMTKINVSIFR